MDSACATLFHSNVNKVSPNRTILAGEKVGIACLLPKQPGVDWYGFLFPAFLWLWLLQVWACWCCTSCYAEVSFVRSTWYKVPGAVPWLLQPLSCTAPEVLQRCHRPTHVPQMAGAGLWLSGGNSCAAALKPGLSGMIYRQQQPRQSQSRVFSAWTGFTPFWREL